MLSFRSTTVVHLLAAVVLLGSGPSQAQSDGKANPVPADGGSDYNGRS